MKLSSRVEIRASAEAVFGALTDFARFEAEAARRGIEVRPVAASGGAQGWQIVLPLRGRIRRIDSRLIRCEPCDLIEYRAESPGYEMVLSLGLVGLARGRTRLNCGFEARPLTLGARFKLQTVRLGKGALSRRFEAELQAYGRRLENRLNAART